MSLHIAKKCNFYNYGGGGGGGGGGGVGEGIAVWLGNQIIHIGRYVLGYS